MAYQNLYEGALALKEKYEVQYKGIESNQNEINQALEAIGELVDYYEYWKNLSPASYELSTSEIEKLVKATEMLNKASSDLDTISATLKTRIGLVKNYIFKLELKIDQERFEEKMREIAEQKRIRELMEELHKPKDYLSRYGLRG
ncbi:MAG: hypothetical protein IKP66_09095 [Lachnospiraceae bacterium]|nr:hypothetical protein [Lachnospiraceae bacterium]